MKVGATGRFPDGRKGTRLLSEQGERPVNPWRVHRTVTDLRNRVQSLGFRPVRLCHARRRLGGPSGRGAFSTRCGQP